MTQPKLTVEGEELWARAAELEEPMPAPPSGSAWAPCELADAYAGAERLTRSANLIKERLKEAEEEWQRLATSLRNAAMAYEEVDLGGAEAIATGGSVSPANAGGAGGDPAAPSDAARGFPSMPPSTGIYMELREAASRIQIGDQGKMLDRFATEWKLYQKKLSEDVEWRFRKFKSWRGEAVEAVEDHFTKQKNWAIGVANIGFDLGRQAGDFVETHRSVVPRDLNFNTYTETMDMPWAGVHPTQFEVNYYDNMYDENERFNKNSDRIPIREAILKQYQRLQQHSEDVQKKYSRKVDSLDIKRPDNPPRAFKIDEPIIYPDHPIIDVYDPDNAPNVTGIDDIPLGSPAGDSGLDDSLPALPSNPFSMPPSTDTPAMPDTAALTDALNGASGGPTGAGLKPASFGGGSGLPSMPLQPPIGMDAEASARAAAAARDAASGLGRGGAGGPMGGGMGGMPMAPGAGGKGGDKAGKRAESDEESLYTEERPWTEAIIGARPRSSKTTPDVKDILPPSNR